MKTALRKAEEEIIALCLKGSLQPARARFAEFQARGIFPANLRFGICRPTMEDAPADALRLHDIQHDEAWAETPAQVARCERRLETLRNEYRKAGFIPHF